MLRTLLLVVTALLAAPPSLPGQSGPVRGVLFFSPTCPHCHVVMNETLPPLQARYGARLVIASVDVSTPEGQELYMATARELGIPQSRFGVPMLVVGDQVMVGAGEIPAYLPGLIEDGLAGGGVAWPAVAELRGALRASGMMAESPTEAEAESGVEAGVAPESAPEPEAGPEPAVEPESAVAPDPTPTGALVPLTPTTAPASMTDRFLLDPVGNGIAVGVLLLLLMALTWAALRIRSAGLPTTVPDSPLLPVILGAGLGVAVYLSLVEVTGTDAVCGPVGDCNTVQQSRWARLFGVLPVGVVGVIGYLAMGAAWLAAGRARLAQSRKGAARLLWLMAFLGTGFSAWLTYLEPFVIGATCAWCVTSALLVGAVLVTTTRRADTAPARPRRGR